MKQTVEEAAALIGVKVHIIKMQRLIMEQERKIGEVFEYNGEKIIVKKDSNFIYGCDRCVFNGKPECGDYYCLYFERQDKQDVHFEKVED